MARAAFSHIQSFMRTAAAVLFASMLAATTSDVQVPGNPACVQDFPTAAAADPNATVVMCGLDNPRGLAFSEFALFVAEAGRGGLGVTAAPCFTGNAAPMANNRCYAPTGAISRLWNGSQERVANGFPSHANLQGRMAIGPTTSLSARRWELEAVGPRSWRLDCNNPPRSGRSTHSSLTSPSLRAWTLTANGVTSPISVPTKPRTIPIECSSVSRSWTQTPMDSSPTAGTSSSPMLAGIPCCAWFPAGTTPQSNTLDGGGVSSQHLPDVRRRCGAYVDCHRSGRRLLRRRADRVPPGSQCREHLACRPLRA